MPTIRRQIKNKTDKEKLVKARQLRDAMKRKAVEQLGGKCVRCGFSDPRALDFHHKDGSGSEHRKLERSALKRYQKTAAGWYNSFLELLCANCHRIQRAEEGLPPYSKLTE